MVYPRSARAGLLGSHYRESAPHPTGLSTFLMKSRGIETGIDIKLAELAWLIGNVIGFEGLSGKPDCASRKLLGVIILAAQGPRSKIDFRADILGTYGWHCTARIADAPYNARAMARSW
jgi:hypothetical protein